MKIKTMLRSSVLFFIKRIPVYLFLPGNSIRDIFMEKYLAHKGKYDLLLSQFRIKGYPNLTKINLKLAIQYLMKTGRDENLQECLDIALNTYPEDSFFYLKYAQYLMYLDKCSFALDYIQKARFLDPGKAECAALSVILCYSTAKDIREADKYALDVLRQFPLNRKVLWSVCKDCTTETQFNEIVKIWSNALDGKKNRDNLYVKTVAPIVNAASRVSLFSKGIELSLKASLLIVQKKASVQKKPKNLGGKNTHTALEDIYNVFEKCGIPFFFAAGTALGIVREGRVLDHDGDIDVGVFENDWSYDKILDAFKSHPRFIVAKPHPKTPKIGLLHRGGADIDIFKFYRENEHFYHDGVFVRWKNSPFDLKKYSVNGLTFNIPEPADKYLTENYGEWRKPDPSFDAFLYAPNTEIKWQEYRDLHAIRTIYNSLCYNNIHRAKRVAMDNMNILAMTTEGKMLAKILLKKELI